MSLRILLTTILAALFILPVFSGCIGILDKYTGVEKKKETSPPKVILHTDPYPMLRDPDPMIGSEGKYFSGDIVDDNVILLALKANQEKKIDLLGIVLSYGCGKLDQAEKEMQVLLDLTGYKIPVFNGAASRYDMGVSNEGVKFMIDSVMKYPGEVTLMAVAPLTDVATAAMLEPKFAHALKQMYIMGGSRYGYSEFNFANDPKAAKLVMNLDVEKVLAPNDIAFENPIYRTEVDEIGKSDSPVAQFVYDLAYKGMVMYPLYHYFLQTPKDPANASVDTSDLHFPAYDEMTLAYLDVFGLQHLYTYEILAVDVNAEGMLPCEQVPAREITSNIVDNCDVGWNLYWGIGGTVFLDPATADPKNIMKVLVDVDRDAWARFFVDSFVNFPAAPVN
ncbi:MAG: nucleoside hydrolase [Candidatus Thermoplasmatota archaeon]|nr:nucleoside hydrolase [Candidatus Thermoplasmatota archaeon]